MIEPYKIMYDRNAGSMYIYLRQGRPVSQRPLSDDVILDIGAKDELIGVEIIGFEDLNVRQLLDELKISPRFAVLIEDIRRFASESQRELAVSIR